MVNVHVGGIPRSIDGGVTWQPTIEVESDVHEVCGHSVHLRTAIAAAVIGLCVSGEGGGTWMVERMGLLASYCSAVALSENVILVAAFTDHFADEGALYRRPLDGKGAQQRVHGLLRWCGGIVDSGCIATSGAALAVADTAGNLYASADDGHSWLHRDKGLPRIGRVLLI